MPNAQPSFGEQLRDWRQRRRLSQLALALDSEISQRHLSFLESGRAQPSREMVLRLIEQLAVPLRARNAILVAAGFAPAYPQRSLDAPELAAARDAVDSILRGHEPHPALAVDRHWTLLAANRALGALLSGVSAELLKPPVNALRVSFHPDGLARRILNFREWRGHVLARLSHDVGVSADTVLAALLDELAAYPVPPTSPPGKRQRSVDSAIAVPLKLASPAGPLSFIGTTTVFGTAIDVSLSEVAIEAFFPADPETARTMAALAAAAEQP